VYNFEVAETHTYFVGTELGGIWMHNTCGPPSEGQEVQRLFGNNAIDEGGSWTREDMYGMDNWRNNLGVGDWNSGEFIAEGEITDPAGLTEMPAEPAEGYDGNGDEVRVNYPVVGDYPIRILWTAPFMQ
jgi:hypothetical protein